MQHVKIKLVLMCLMNLQKEINHSFFEMEKP